MNCIEFDRYLDDYLSEELNEQDELAFLSHVDGCNGCSTELEAARSMGDTLRSMPVPPPSAGFADRILQQARNSTSSANVNDREANGASSRRSRSGFAMGFSSALAAGVVLWGVIALFPSLNAPVLQDVAQQAAPMAGVTIALDETSQVNLVFESVAALENAKISIELPSNIALPGHPELRHVEWRTNLVKGSNLLRLPVIATQLGQAQTLVAHIEYGDQKVTTLKIKLSVIKKILS